ncbi:DUF3551 domain-containing protein [Tardiphaga alba]|nr:DUF3551 domain-containing protein [Tardiphaga alba]
MRSFLAATTLLLAAGGLNAIGTTAAEAREYPWCSRTSASGFNPSCSFTSYNQCMATVSGQRGDCMRNPVLAFGEQNQPRRKGRVQRERDGWDNGWNNNNNWGPRW